MQNMGNKDKMATRYTHEISRTSAHLPWCSSGKLSNGKKSRRLTPAWEIRSSYPVRENIWEYVHGDKANFGHRQRAARAGRQTRANKGRKKVVLHFVSFFLVLLIVLGVTALLWENERDLTDILMDNIPKWKFISLSLVEAPVDGECCYRMKHLAAALHRSDQTLRNTFRLRKTMLTSQAVKTEAPNAARGGYIDGAVVSVGSGTEEWRVRVGLWGVVPLWHVALPPDTVLASRSPTPADCWPFRGSYGELVIELPHRTAVSHFSVEHVRPDTALSAPKHFALYGILENGTWIKSVEAEYKHAGPAKQYYPLLHKHIPLRHIVFRVLSNQGNPQYTCIYRVQVYEVY